MEMNDKALLRLIKEAQFACVELQLYLDTHPDDAAAMDDYRCYSDKLAMLMARYEQEYGPLMNFGHSVSDTGSWVYQKWPWEL
ncbi:MAG: spore coat protein CotJB [Clostridia bacterium]|nr:spore coat protein CotJB [Clostridia bacterium]